MHSQGELLRLHMMCPINFSTYFGLFSQCVGGDIEYLEYTLKPKFEGNFKVANMSSEVDLAFSFYP
jgi:hypothetical protein